MLSNWIFYTKDTPIDSQELFIGIDELTPLKGTGSLLLQDYATPDKETVAATWNPADCLISGKFVTVFEHHNSDGFRENGLFFLLSEMNPLSDTCAGYAVSLVDDTTIIRINKFTQGLHGTKTVLYQFLDPLITNSVDPIILSVSWYSGIFLDTFHGTHISIDIALNTINESLLVNIGSFTDTNIIYNSSLGEGLYCQSSNGLDPLYGKFDQTKIYTIKAKG